MVGDTLLVYFSGHGFRDDDGKLYLAPLDVDPEDPAGTGVPAEWLREQIGRCKAKFKLLVLDACHAGSEKGEDDDATSSSVAAKDLGDLFRNLEGVVTLASSTADEKSQTWDEKEQSLFSYWLNQGLKGHADGNADSTVDIDELYKFVYGNVIYTAKQRFPRPQTPVRIVRSGTPDVPAVVKLRPQTLRDALAGIAEFLADRVDERRLDRVGVLEFTNHTPRGEFLGANYANLGKWCTSEFERQLGDFALGKFALVDRRRLQTMLNDEGFELADLGSGRRMTQLAKSVGGMPIVALGTLKDRHGRIVTIECELQNVDTGERLGDKAVATAQLNESEWAMLGRSVVLTSDDRTIPVDEVGIVSPAEHVIQAADEKSRGAHPFKDPAFDFPIKIMIGGKVRPFIFKTVGERRRSYKRWRKYLRGSRRQSCRGRSVHPSVVQEVRPPLTPQGVEKHLAGSSR